MAVDTSANGLIATVIAKQTYPNGFVISEWSGESDPLDVPEITIREYQMGPNGDLETWSTPQPIKIKISVIANTPSDTYLTYLYNSARVAKGKKSVKEEITMVFTYPDGEIKTLKKGFIDTGVPLKTVATSGKIKVRTFAFTFEDII